MPWVPTSLRNSERPPASCTSIETGTGALGRTLDLGTPRAKAVLVTPDGKTMWVNSKMNSHVYAYSLPDLTLLGGVTLTNAGEFTAFDAALITGTDIDSFINSGTFRCGDVNGNGRFDQRPAHPALPPRPRHEQARDRPHRLLVQPRQDTRAVESRVLLARLDRAPADRLLAGVGEDPGLLPVADDAPERGAVAGSLAGRVCLRLQAPVHAPAAGACAALAEERFDVPPSIGRNGPERERWGGLARGVGRLCPRSLRALVSHSPPTNTLPCGRAAPVAPCGHSARSNDTPGRSEPGSRKRSSSESAPVAGSMPTASAGLAG